MQFALAGKTMRQLRRLTVARLLATLAAVGAGIPSLATADTFLVTTTADGGPGSLRQAIEMANSKATSLACPPQTIEFAVPGPGVHTIRPTTALPDLRIPILIDGYSQPGASANTLANGSDAVLLIELDGSQAGNSSGLSLLPRNIPAGFPCSAQSSHIQGLVINRFQQAGIAVDASSCNTLSFCNVFNVGITGNHIGTDPSGLVAHGNGFGVALGSLTSDNRVGALVPDGGGTDMPDPSVRNVISGNVGAGILVTAGVVAGVQTESANQSIRGNFIGIGADGRTPLGNGGDGISALRGAIKVRVRHNVIANNAGHGVFVADDEIGRSAIYANAIGVGLGHVPAGNHGDGIRIAGNSRGVEAGGYYPPLSDDRASIAFNGGAGVTVMEQAIADINTASIGSNGGLAVDLAPPGPTPNDPGDVDNGPNELLNHPLVDLATAPTAGLPGRIEGSLSARPSKTYEVGLYISDQCGPFGRGDMQRRLPANLTQVQTDAAGHGRFTTTAPWMPAGRYVTAVTRSFTEVVGTPGIEVSEPSPCFLVSGDDRVFRNGFDPP